MNATGDPLHRQHHRSGERARQFLSFTGKPNDKAPSIYDKKRRGQHTLTAESLAKAITDAGLVKESATVAFFCQGPECHRSYNATFVAITEWGYKPEQII